MPERAALTENLAGFLSHRAPHLRRVLLRILVVGVPLIFLPVTADPFAIPKLSLLLIGVSVVGALRIAELAQGRQLNYVGMAIPVSAIVIPLLVAWIVGPYRAWSLLGEYGRFLGLVPYLLLAALGLLVADAFGGRLRDLARSFLWAGAIAGAYATLQHFGIDVFDWGQQFGGAATQTSTIGNPNFTGGFLAIVLPVGVALASAEEQERRLMAALSGLVLGGLIFTFSQGAWAAAAGGVAIVIGALLKPKVRLAPVAATALVLLMMLAIVARVGQSMTERSIDSTSTTQLRGLWWETALRMASDAPVLGRGPNAYAVESPQYRSEEEASLMGFDTSNDPHSVPLTFLTSAGALGLLGFLVLFGWTAWRWRRISEADGDVLHRVGFAGGAAAYFVQSMVAVDEITVRFGLWVCIGALGAAALQPAQAGRASTKGRKGRSKTGQTPQLKNVPAISGAAVVAVAGLLWGLNLLVNDMRIEDAQAQAKAGQAGAARDTFASVGGVGMYDYRHKEGFYLGRLALAFQRDGRSDVSKTFLEDALEAFSYLEDFPSVPGWRDRSSLLLAYSQTDSSYRDEAIESYAHALTLDPHNASLQAEAAAAAAPPADE